MKVTLKSLSYYFGNIFIVLSFFGFFYTYYPLIQTYILPQKVVASYQEGTRIAIPKINAYSPIVTEVNPWNETEYKKALKKGVAHAKGFALPGEKGLSYLFAHSSGMPWEETRYNTIFLRLGELEKGDKIEITREGVTHTYSVSEKKEVWPQEVGFLLRSERTALVLQTCTPIGTSLKRLLVFAEPT